MQNTTTVTQGLTEKLGGRWVAVSVDELEYDHLGQTPLVERVDGSNHAPTHFQTIPLSVSEASAIASALARVTNQPIERLDFVAGQQIVRISANAANDVMNAQSETLRIPDHMTRY